MTDPSDTKLKIRYQEMAARYANQVIIHSTKEEVIMDFSSGVVPDPITGESTIPVHTRIALTMGGARRLYELLGRSLERDSSAPQT